MNAALDHEINEQQLGQQLIARNLAELFDWLLDLKGKTLKESYTFRWLYAVGGQSILYLAEDLDGKPVLVKMALLPYHRAAYVTAEDISQARRRLKREAENLKRFQSSILPAYYDLIYDTNPLLSPARGEIIVQNEPFLLMEFLEGQTLQQVTHTLHLTDQPPYPLLEWLAWQIVRDTTGFLLVLSQEEQPYLYVDFTASNIFLTWNPERPLRLLDAGSLVPLHADPAISPPFTWAYTSPDYYEAYDKGQHIWPTPFYVMYTLGKVLWQLLTGQQLISGRDPDLSLPILQHYSSALQETMSNLLRGTYDNFDHLKQSIHPSFSSEKQHLIDLREFLNDFNQTLQTKKQNAKAISPLQIIRNEKAGTQLIEEKKAQTDVVQMLRYSPDGRFFAIASYQRIELWNADSLQKEKVFKSSQLGKAMSLDFDLSGQYLASGGILNDTGHIALWHISLADAIWKHQVRGYNGNITLNGQSDLLAAGSKWSVATFHPQQTLLTGQSYEGFVDRGVSGILSKRYPLLAVGGLWGTRLWNVQTHELLKPDLWYSTETLVEKLAFGDNDSILAMLILNLSTHTLMRYSIKIWEMSASRTLLWQIDVPATKVSDMRLSASDRLLIVGSPDGQIWVWNIEQKQELAHLENCGLICSLDFDAQKRMLATATSDGEIHIYHLEET